MATSGLTEDTRLEIGHVLFIDIIGYSKLLANEQRERVQELNRIVRETGQFRAAEAEGKLLRIPTGDGMVLAFFTSPGAPVRCAVAISRAIGDPKNLPLRMGIHSGPVDLVEDVNDKPNLTGAGVNMAQRVMDCGDAGHILLSARAADDLAQYAEWQTQLHELGEVEVKHGLRVRVASLYSDEIGNRSLPQKILRQRARRRRQLTVAIITLLVLLAGATLATWLWRNHVKSLERSAAQAAAEREKSVAVLPFESVSAGEENTVFAGGVHREVLLNLAKVADLKVISRDSVVHYKPGLERNLKQIADQLGVNYVVEGSVQREADHVRVNIELINAHTDVHVWAESYDGKVADIISFQSEIAQRITNQLGAKLSQREAADLAAAPTHDMPAFENYVRARTLMETPELEDNEDQYVADEKRAAELLEQAVARDRQFTLAYCALANANIQLHRHYARTTTEYRDRAEAALKEAQAVAPNAGETIYARALIIYYGYSDFKRALATLEEAAKLLPNDSNIALTRGLLYRRFGRWQEAYAQFVKETELNPREPLNYINAAMAAMNLRWWSESDHLRELIIRRFPQLAHGVRFAAVYSLRMRGEVDAGNKLMDQINFDLRTGFGPLFFRAFWKHDYAEARRLLKEGENDPELKGNLWLFEASMVAVGQEAVADRAWTVAAESKLEEQLKNPANEEDEGLHEDLALVEGILGKKEESIRLREEWLQRHPVSADYLTNVGAVRHAAYGYILTGEKERAIDTLQKIVQIPGGIFYGELKYNPIFDALRKDRRFADIVEQARQPFPRL